MKQKLKIESIACLITLLTGVGYFLGFTLWRKYLDKWDISELPILSLEDLLFPLAEFLFAIVLICSLSFWFNIGQALSPIKKETKTSKRFQKRLDYALFGALILLIGWFFITSLWYKNEMWLPLFLLVIIAVPVVCWRAKASISMILFSFLVSTFVVGLLFVNWLIEHLDTSSSPQKTKVLIHVEGRTWGDDKNERVLFAGHKSVVVSDSSADTVIVYQLDKVAYIKSIKIKQNGI